MKIGLTGGIGCGKSTVTEQFAKHGFHDYSADRICHKAYLDETVIRKLHERWGDSFLDDGGRVVRSAVADKVFEDETELEFLSGVLYPYLAAELGRILALEEKGGYDVIFEVPLLFEVGWESYFDLTMAVWSEKSIRYARLAGRGWSEREIERREKRQFSAEKKLELASIGLINNSTPANLEKQCRRLLGLPLTWND